LGPADREEILEDQAQADDGHQENQGPDGPTCANQFPESHPASLFLLGRRRSAQVINAQVINARVVNTGVVNTGVVNTGVVNTGSVITRSVITRAVNGRFFKTGVVLSPSRAQTPAEKHNQDDGP